MGYQQGDLVVHSRHGAMQGLIAAVCFCAAGRVVVNVGGLVVSWHPSRMRLASEEEQALWRLGWVR